MRVLALLCALFPFTLAADDTADIVDTVVAGHILPGFMQLSYETNALKTVAGSDCKSTSVPLRAAFHTAFDFWVSVSHLRFGPTETDDRAFALAYWPDSRGFTPKTLSSLISQEDPVINTLDGFRDVSIAGRGFYALEFLLYDDAISSLGGDAYRCQLIQTITADIAALSLAILDDWTHIYVAQMRAPSPEGRYRTKAEAVQELFKSLNAGLQFTSETRLGRPLGAFDRPRPKRAEARRSGRALHHVDLSLTALNALAQMLAQSDPSVAAQLDRAFDRALRNSDRLDDPVFAGVANPQSRLRVEVLQQSVEDIRAITQENLGPMLGVAAGFNSLDGD